MKKRRSSLRMITILLSVTFAAMWAVSMVCLTYATGTMIMERQLEAAEGYDSYVVNYSAGGALDNFVEEDSDTYLQHREHPEKLQEAAVRAIAYSNHYRRYSMEKADGNILGVLLRSVEVPNTKAVVIRDADYQVIAQSGDSIVGRDESYWMTQDQWETGEYGTDGYWIDLQDSSMQENFSAIYAIRAKAKELYALPDECKLMKITGTLDGSQILPTAAWYVSDEDLYTVWEQMKGDEADYTDYYYAECSVMDHTVGLPWRCIFDSGNSSAGTQTFYLYEPILSDYAEEPVTIRTGTYGSALELLMSDEASHILLSDTYYDLCEDAEYPIQNTIQQVLDLSQYRVVDSADPGGGSQHAEFTVETLYVAYPLKAAMSSLLYVYIATALLMTVIIWFLRRNLYNSLVRPMEVLNDSLRQRKPVYGSDIDHSHLWNEQNELYESYSEEMKRQQADRDHIADLDRALKYAEQSEQNRREMTSAIAHELKTPLAIIHSYAEGLQENIAEDKRDQYLDIIISETERMDGMVLEMLDLSRLESGRVKMNMQDVSLRELAAEQVKRFRTLAQERDLNLHENYRIEGLCKGDRKWLGQVLDNFISNAVRYASEGSRVKIILREDKQEGIIFAVENDTDRPFTQEELTKVFDSFYRTDPARSNRSTGLGLAIARNIIELHGGTCRAYNTSTGVGFSFALPSE